MSQANQNLRLQWLDAVRCLAVAGVVIVHCAQQIPPNSDWLDKIARQGHYGVQLFFVISAYTVGLTLDRANNTTQGRVFWLANRYFRIAPLYYFGIVAYSLLSILLSALALPRGGQQISSLNILLNVAFLHGWFPSASNTVVPGGWSIGAEMSFYLLSAFMWPLMKTVKQILYWLIAAVILAYSLGILDSDITETDFLYYSPPMQLVIFTLGLLHYRIQERATMLERAELRLILSLPMLVVCAHFIVDHYSPGISSSTISRNIAVGGLCIGLLHLASLAPSCCAIISLFGRVGTYTYSIYIVHFVIVWGLAFTFRRLWGQSNLEQSNLAFLLLVGLAFMISLLLAQLTQRYVESKGIKIGRRLLQRPMSAAF